MAEIGYGYNKSSIQYMARDYAVSVREEVQASNAFSNLGSMDSCKDDRNKKLQNHTS